MHGGGKLCNTEIRLQYLNGKIISIIIAKQLRIASNDIQTFLHIICTLYYSFTLILTIERENIVLMECEIRKRLFQIILCYS